MFIILQHSLIKFSNRKLLLFNDWPWLLIYYRVSTFTFNQYNMLVLVELYFVLI